MNNGAVSVIIVSRHRPAALLRCIVGLSQQDHTDFELIVVADSKAAARVRDLNAPIKVIAFDTPNISAARNAGLAQAAGAIVAFIDDDAVPEPTWLTRLTSPSRNAASVHTTVVASSAHRARSISVRATVVTGTLKVQFPDTAGCGCPVPFGMIAAIGVVMFPTTC